MEEAVCVTQGHGIAVHGELSERGATRQHRLAEARHLAVQQPIRIANGRREAGGRELPRRCTARQDGLAVPSHLGVQRPGIVQALDRQTSRGIGPGRRSAGQGPHHALGKISLIEG